MVHVVSGVEDVGSGRPLLAGIHRAAAAAKTHAANFISVQP